MNKLTILSMLLGSLGTTAILSGIEPMQINSLYQNKVLDMNFNTNEIKNTVNNKTYSSLKGTGNLVNSIKGKGFETNSDLIRIPSSDLNIPTTQEYVTVTAHYKYGGTDTEQMIFAFGLSDIWMHNGWIGFNTASGDMYGIEYTPPTTEYITITAVFHKSDMSKRKLYINGVKQNLTYRDSSIATTRENPFGQDFYISSWEQYYHEHYLADGKNIIDEIMIFKGDVTDNEAEKLAMAHRIPELSVRQEGLYAQANWATEILESDTIYNYGFEEGEIIPSFRSASNINGDTTGGQKITTDESYSGLRSIYTPKTTGGLGNHYQFPATQSDRNIMMFNRHYFNNGTKLSVSFRVKDVSGNNTISANGDGGWGNTLAKLSPTIVENSPAGSKTIRVNSLSGIYLGLYITSDRNVIYGAEYCRQIRNIQDNGDGTYTLTVNTGFVYEQTAGDTLYTRPWRGAWSFGSKVHNSNEWQLYNLNTSVSNYSDYDVAVKGGAFYINTVNQGLSYLDDLKFGYATKVKLYRDNTLAYEGYESQLTDKNATDKVKPIMSDVSINTTYEGNNREVTLSFPTVVDTGTTYNYSIKSVGESGKETFLTEDKPINVTSGLKGYSYIIDKNATTVPGNTVNLSASSTTISHTISMNDTGAYYLHIKPIDNQGNIGDVKHILIDNPTLTTQVKPVEDRIRLDWNMIDKDNKTFKVYQKKEGSNEFQTVSLTDLNNSKQVRVLNVYPTSSSESVGIGEITFTTWDGESLTLPTSAQLKKWMEEPNAENPKGYGKGLIEVTPVAQSTFNSNATSYLKNSDGTWKYDVIMFGTWDSNAGNDMSSSALVVVKEFIDSGRGVLLGHDTMRGWITQFAQLKEYLNLDLEMAYEGLNYSGTTVSVNKKGLLTNYPWEIGDIGTKLTIPNTHTVNQMAKGDIWLRFGASPVVSDRNFYLTSWNNTAFIQTGHSNAQATPDEQKILANTLFYLNQLSTDNFLDDNSGQDVKAPNKPVVSNYSINTNGQITYNLASGIDNGSTYEYYVQSENKNGKDTTLSNITTNTITSGFKGFSFIVDSNPNTTPDNVIDTTSEEITANISSNNTYIHIKAIDNVGNASEVLHYNISDTTAPTMNITGNPTNWTNQNATLTVTANDMGTGIKHIVLPNGTIVTGNSASYTVSSNGSYIFNVVDKMGNMTTQTVVVDKIDKGINTLNGVNLIMNMINTTNSTRRMTFTFNPVVDNGSGLKGYSYVIDNNPNTIPDNNINTTGTIITKDITDTGVYYLHIKAIDNANNISNIVHHKVDIPTVTSSVNSNENFIKLNWSMNDYTNKTFKVFQKKPGSNEFQTIGTNNLDTSKQVKVLNVYPAGVGDNLSPITPITFTTWDGETLTLDKSGSLKKWMEEPNTEHSKGYGQGIIEVTPVTFAEFNANPSNYLSKDTDGKWNYDVVFVGAYDCNGSCTLQGNFSTGTANYVTNYVDDGYGFLMGHDFNTLRSRLGTSVGSVGALSSDLITINKKGIMTSYPWNLGEIGDVLNIPYAHNNGRLSDGDIWFKFAENTNPTHCKTWCAIEKQTETHNNNHYLVTKNNLGMIETGHSNGNATTDEMKILANTLLYLKQLSTDNYLDDMSGSDITAPNMPKFTSHNFTEDGYINLNFNEVIDNGSEYSYYVESQTRDIDSLTLSNVVTETITSGIKGYSYVVDSNATTIPDNEIEQSSNETIKLKTKPNQELYVHIRAIDNVGNGSETYHYRITDNIAPTLNFELVPNTWTNGTVTINVTATDSGSGVKYLVLPNGSIIKGNISNYTVENNGIYYFKAIDYMGNETISSIIVSNIDKKKPTVSINNNQNWTNQDVQVTITSSDD